MNIPTPDKFTNWTAYVQSWEIQNDAAEYQAWLESEKQKKAQRKRRRHNRAERRAHRAAKAQSLSLEHNHLKDGKHCFYCGREVIAPNDHAGKQYAKTHPPDVRTKDHLIPKCRGGLNKSSNYVWACNECNQDKGHLTLDEYRAVIAVRRGLIAVPGLRFAGEERLSVMNVSVSGSLGTESLHD